MTPSRLTSRPSARPGFSLIEILTVIGILTVLIALAVIGFRVVGSVMRKKVTETQLENAKSLLKEFTITSSVDNLILVYPSGQNGWQNPTDSTKPYTLTYGRFAASDDNDLDPNMASNAQMETARIMARLQAVPKDRSIIAGLSPDRVRNVNFAVITTTTPNLVAGQGPVLLDGSGHPIYFVPGGGLTGVRRGYKGNNLPVGDASSYDEPNVTVRAPDGQPFFVSGGPDGNLATGDDNIYSFGD